MALEDQLHGHAHGQNEPSSRKHMLQDELEDEDAHILGRLRGMEDGEDI